MIGVLEPFEQVTDEIWRNNIGACEGVEHIRKQSEDMIPGGKEYTFDMIQAAIWLVP